MKLTLELSFIPEERPDQEGTNGVSDSGPSSINSNAAQSKYVTPDIQALIRSSCQFDPSNRPSASDFLSSKIFRASSISLDSASLRSRIGVTQRAGDEAIARGFEPKSPVNGIEVVQNGLNGLVMEEIDWSL